MKVCCCGEEKKLFMSVVYCCVKQLPKHGHYCLSQLCIKRGDIEFLKSLAPESVTVSVEGADFIVDLTPVQRKCTGDSA